MPKQILFFNILKEVADRLVEMMNLFAEMDSNFRDFEAYARKAKEIEHKADVKTHEIIDHLNKMFITPIDREDIYLLAHQLDNIVDLLESAIRNIYLYQIDEKNDAISEFAALFKEVSVHFDGLFDCLKKQKYTKDLLDVKIKIHELEDKGDVVFEKAISELFEKEKDSIKIIKWKDILETLEDVMDECQTLSNIVEGIIVKST